MEARQYIALWPSASEEIGVIFSANPDPSKLPSTIGKKAVSFEEAQKQPPDKTKSRSQLVCINRESDITEEQIRQLEAVLAKHEALFADKLGLAIEPEEDWL